MPSGALTSDTTALEVQKPPSGAQLFSTGDRLRIKSVIDGSQEDNWLEVMGSPVDGGNSHIYPVQKKDGDSATFPKGTAVVNYGQSGDGFVKITSDEADGPFIDVSVTGAEPWNGDITNHVRMGYLNGLAVAGDEWGLAAGNDLSDSAQAHVIISDTQVALKGVAQTWWDGAGNTRGELDPSATGNDDLFWLGVSAADKKLQLQADGDLVIDGEITASSGVIGGWTVTSDELHNTHIWLDAAAKQIAIKDQTFSNAGIQLEYNSGSPRAYIGDGSNAYLNFDGTKLTWQAANTELDGSGNLTASSATVSGAITATSGAIAGWSIGADAITKDGNIGIDSGTKDIWINSQTWANEGIQLQYNGGTPRLYVGDGSSKHLKFDGTDLYCTGAIFESPASGSDLSLLGWQFDATFSASDADTVAWTSGTLIFGSGQSFSIDAGNTGDMAAKTYIYFDKDTSETVLQTSTTAGDAVGHDKMLIAVAEDDDDGNEAFFLVFGGRGDKLVHGDEIVANTITASNIAANTVTANEIAANTITASEIGAGVITATEIAADTITAGNISAGAVDTSELAAGAVEADKINVASLSAIAADMGSLTAGSVVITTGTDKIWLNDSDDGGLHIGGTVKGSAPFSVAADGSLTATGATISGALTATTGAVGGWTIDADEIKNIAANAGITMDSDDPKIVMTDGTPVERVFLGYDGTDYILKIKNSSGNTIFDSTDGGGTTPSLAGWDITQYTLKADSGAVGMNSEATGGTDWRFWAGNVTPGSAPFRVDEDGNLVASSATITGEVTAETGTIGGWTVLSTELHNTDLWLDADAKQIAINDQTFSNQGIQLEYNGGSPRAYIGDGSNAYLNFDGAKLMWKASNTELDSSGNLTASSATISGEVTAESGTIGGWTLTADELHNTNIWLDAADKQVAINNQTFGQDGIQLEYNGGNPRAYIGDGSNKYFQFDGTNISWKAQNTELDTDGNLTASSATLSGELTATSGTIGGWTVTTNLLHNSSHINLDANSKSIWIEDETFGNAGIQIEYNGGSPRFHIGDGAKFVKFDGADLTWDGGNTSLDSSGDLTCAGGTIGGWTIGASTLSSSNITLDDGNDKITVGGITLDGAAADIESSTYSSGVSGFHIDEDFAEFGNVEIRGTMSAMVLKYQEVTAVGGSFVVSNASKLASDAASGQADLVVEDGSRFSVGDDVRISEGGTTETGEIDSISTNTLTLTGNLTNSWNAGAAVVKWEERILMTVDMANSPYISIVDDSSPNAEKVRIGDLSGVAGCSGYGLWSDNVFLEGKIVATSGEIGTGIDTWEITGESLYSKQVVICADGYISVGAGDNRITLSTVEPGYRMWSGSAADAPEDGVFQILQAGGVVCSSMEITGGSITGVDQYWKDSAGNTKGALDPNATTPYASVTGDLTGCSKVLLEQGDGDLFWLGRSEREKQFRVTASGDVLLDRANVKLDDDGLTIVLGSDFDYSRALGFNIPGENLGTYPPFGIYSSYSDEVVDSFVHTYTLPYDRDARTSVMAQAPSGKSAEVTLLAWGDGYNSDLAQISLYSNDDTYGSKTVFFGDTQFLQGSLDAGTTFVQGLSIGEKSDVPSSNSLVIEERSSDPVQPGEGDATIWLSDGTGAGDDGDIMILVNAGNRVVYGTLFDYSGASDYPNIAAEAIACSATVAEPTLTIV